VLIAALKGAVYKTVGCRIELNGAGQVGDCFVMASVAL
jgi:hypothetical protein